MRVRTLLICSFLGFGAVLPASGIPAKRSPRARMLEYGLFQPDDEGVVVNEPRSSSGKKVINRDGHFYKQTDRVPMQLGICFDMWFVITDITEGNVIEVEKRVEHPPFKNYKGQVETNYTVLLRLDVVDGSAEDTTGIILNHEEELVPGVWKFEFWYQGRKLLTQSFTVYPPK